MLKILPRLVLMVACGMGLFFAGCDRSEQGKAESNSDGVVRREGEPDYVRVGDQPLMDRATAKARQTQGEFLASLKSPGPKHRGHSIKKGFPTPDGGLEHIWINEVRWDGKVFQGVINNEPVETTAVKLGDRVTVKPEEMSDWMFVDGNMLVGGYTVRVLHHEQSPEDKEAFRKQTGLIVPPVDF